MIAAGRHIALDRACGQGRKSRASEHVFLNAFMKCKLAHLAFVAWGWPSYFSSEQRMQVINGLRQTQGNSISTGTQEALLTILEVLSCNGDEWMEPRLLTSRPQGRRSRSTKRTTLAHWRALALHKISPQSNGSFICPSGQSSVLA